MNEWSILIDENREIIKVVPSIQFGFDLVCVFVVICRDSSLFNLYVLFLFSSSLSLSILLCPVYRTPFKPLHTIYFFLLLLRLCHMCICVGCVCIFIIECVLEEKLFSIFIVYSSYCQHRLNVHMCCTLIICFCVKF